MNQQAAISILDKRRSPIHGLKQIVRFNWPKYVIGFTCSAGALLLLLVTAMPALMSWLIFIGIFAAVWWLIASLVVSYWIYDRSALTRWTWLRSHLDESAAAGRLLNIHCGFDDTTRQLRRVFPRAVVSVVDLYDATRMTEPSIHRARRANPPLSGTLAGRSDCLPVDDLSVDAAHLLLAAHELRRPIEREDLFTEVHRVLKPGGRLMLVEHARDGWNFLAFGPGFLHFMPFREWRRLADGAGFTIVHETRITPFIRALIAQKDR